MKYKEIKMNKKIYFVSLDQKSNRKHLARWWCNFTVVAKTRTKAKKLAFKRLQNWNNRYRGYTLEEFDCSISESKISGRSRVIEDNLA